MGVGRMSAFPEIFRPNEGREQTEAHREKDLEPDATMNRRGASSDPKAEGPGVRIDRAPRDRTCLPGDAWQQGPGPASFGRRCCRFDAKEYARRRR